MLTLKCLILRYSNALCPSPICAAYKAEDKKPGCQGLAHAPASQDSAPASDKDAVSQKTLSLGLQVVLLAAQAFGGKFES